MKNFIDFNFQYNRSLASQQYTSLLPIRLLIIDTPYHQYTSSLIHPIIDTRDPRYTSSEKATPIVLWLRISPKWMYAAGTSMISPQSRSRWGPTVHEGATSSGKPLAYSKSHDVEARRPASWMQQARLYLGKLGLHLLTARCSRTGEVS